MANFNFNKVILGGRLTGDPELKTTPSGVSVTSFSVAVNRQYKPKQTGSAAGDGVAQADFITCVAWRSAAEFITRYFRKGSSICVVGSIQTRSWTDDKGQKRYATEVVADEVHFVDAKGNSAGDSGQAVSGASAPAAPAFSEPPHWEDVSDGEELPF